jgi:hypothetical protein
VGDQARGRRHDLWRRPEVLPEGANARTSIDVLKGVEPAHIGAPPAVDGLIIIGPERHRAVGSGQLLDQGVLEGAEVLSFVDEDRPEARAQSVAESGITMEERDGFGQQAREIEGVGLAAPGAISGQQLADICRASWMQLAALGSLEGLGEARGITGEDEIPAELLDQAAGIGAVEDGECRRAGDGARLAPERPGAEAVERPRPDVPRLGTDSLPDAADQLGGGGAREGVGEDLTGAKALMDEPVDPVVRIRVLPLPGPQARRTGRAGWVTAARWAGVSAVRSGASRVVAGLVCRGGYRGAI